MSINIPTQHGTAIVNGMKVPYITRRRMNGNNGQKKLEKAIGEHIKRIEGKGLSLLPSQQSLVKLVPSIKRLLSELVATTAKANNYWRSSSTKYRKYFDKLSTDEGFWTNRGTVKQDIDSIIRDSKLPRKMVEIGYLNALNHYIHTVPDVNIVYEALHGLSAADYVLNKIE